MDKNKLILPITIILASIILGGFYYASQANKQASIERQQETEIAEKRRIKEMEMVEERIIKEMDIAEEKRIQEEAAEEKEKIALQKRLCVSEAEKSAVDLYKDYCTKSEYCTYEEGVFQVPQYENAYSICLQRNGLK